MSDMPAEVAALIATGWYAGTNPTPAEFSKGNLLKIVASMTAALEAAYSGTPQDPRMVRSAMGHMMPDTPEPKIGPRGGSGASDAQDTGQAERSGILGVLHCHPGCVTECGAALPAPQKVPSRQEVEHVLSQFRLVDGGLLPSEVEGIAAAVLALFPVHPADEGGIR